MTKRNTTKVNDSKAVAYVRVSTDEQKLGPEAQKAAILAWAAREGIEVVSWHEDLGVSGAAPLDKRPGLVEALAALRVHGAGRFVVAKMDRVARSVLNAELVGQEVARAGARVVSADGVANEGTPEAAMLRGILAVTAAYERELIRSRTRAALAAKKARGEALGCAPFGFQAVGGRLEPCPVEQVCLARIEALRAAGESRRGIVARLAAEGFAGRSGKPLGLTQVQRILARTPA